MGGNKFLLLGGIVLLSFLAAGCVQQGGLQFDNQTAQATATPSLTAAEQELLKYPELAGYLQAYQNIGTPAQRPDYLPSVVFSKLPPFPKDFYSIALLVRLGKFTDMNKIGEAYWKQPEFYPQFIEQGVSLYQHPDTGRWTAFGLGATPSEVVVLNPRSGEIDLAFFMFSSWTVQTYQGMMLNYDFPKSSELVYSQFPDTSKNLTQDPDKVRQYFDVEITPKEILLQPNFPVFEKDWTQKISVKIRVKNAPPGRYGIGIGSQPPSQEKADEWLWTYKERYTSGAGIAANVGRPWDSIFIDIT